MTRLALKRLGFAFAAVAVIYGGLAAAIVALERFTR